MDWKLRKCCDVKDKDMYASKMYLVLRVTAVAVENHRYAGVDLALGKG